MNQKESFIKNVNKLKSYIQRVSDGEDMESVQADFKENFEHVPAKMIAKAEQQMMADGAQMEDIQKLCDIHSVLFKDMTDEERMERLKEEMKAHSQTVYVKQEEIENVDDEVSEKTIQFKNTPGHPLNILNMENNAIQKHIDMLRSKIDQSNDISLLNEDIISLRSIKQHYSKKDNLLFPLLSDKYNYPGPANVMWGVEDEIRDELNKVHDKKSLSHVLDRIEEMIYKEENILFPLCTENFNNDEWTEITDDLHSYETCLIDKIPKQDEKISRKDKLNVTDDIISLPGGTLTLKQLRAMLNIIPMEITIIDENDINRFFDEDKNKVFLRPKTALNRNMHSCHPPRVIKMVDKLLNDFKSGKRDSMHVLSEVNEINVLTNYYALRDDNGEYLGTMEAVIHIDGIIDCTRNNISGPVSSDKIFPNQ